MFINSQVLDRSIPSSKESYPKANHQISTTNFFQRASSHRIQTIIQTKSFKKKKSMYPVILSVLAMAATAIAAPSAGLAPRQCTYATAQYLSICQQGVNLFCTGDTNICPSGKTDTFDAKATAANEAACSGLTVSSSCMITVACC